MAEENRLWGAERIRGERLKVGIRVSKRTIQRYLPKERKKFRPNMGNLHQKPYGRHLGLRLHRGTRHLISPD